MIPRQVERTIIRGGEFKERKMAFDTKSMPHLQTILRTGLYTNKVKSLIREYLCNAIDEHVKINSDASVVVQFPNAFTPEFRVRDFGAGLLPAVYSETCLATHQYVDNNEIKTKICDGKVTVKNWYGICETCGESNENLIGGVFKFFGDYGASDKRQTNELIGSFGIGCKSAFCYTDAFSVISVKDGMKWIFNIFIDSTNEGSVALLTEEKTDDPNGVEIVVSVKKDDIHKFTSNGYEVIKYLRTKPTIKGVTNPPSFERPTPVLSGDFWTYYGDHRETVIIQGQIGYPISASDVGTHHYGTPDTMPEKGFISEWEYALLTSGLEIEVKIGEVEVTASREGLQMSDYTITTIRKKLAEIQAEIQDHASEKLKSAKTMIEAKTAYYELFQKGGSYGYQLQKAIGEVKWNNTVITNSTIKLDENKHKVFVYTSRRNGNIYQSTVDRLQCSDKLNLYNDDTDKKSFMYRRRAKTLLDAGAEQVTIIQTTDPKGLLKETGIDVTKLPQYSTVTPTVLVSNRKVGTGVDAAKRAKHQVSVFQLDTNKLAAYSKGANSDYWKVASIVPDKQVYIPIERFIPTGVGLDSLQALQRKLSELKSIGAEVTVPIYGLKLKQSAGDMVKFDTILKDHISKIPKLADEAALLEDFTSTTPVRLKVAMEKLPDGSAAKAYKKLYDEAQKIREDGNSSIKMKLASWAGLTSKRKGEFEKAWEAMQKTYPLFVDSQRRNYYESEKDTSKSAALAEYIQLIYEAKEK
jgi:hypothetical protein